MRGTTRKGQERLRNKTFRWKKWSKIFNYVKSLQKEGFLSRVVNSETQEIATNDYNKAEQKVLCFYRNGF